MRKLLAALVLAAVCAACSGGSGSRPRATPGRPEGGPATSHAAAGTTEPPPKVPVDPDVAALPDGRGAKLAVVVDDVGGVDTYLDDYLKLPIPLTLSVIPAFANASADDAKIAAAGKEVLLHIPLANRAGPGGVPDGGLGVDATPEAVDQWVAAAVAKVPHADGANNHEGPYGSSSPPLMQRLIAALNARHLFFIDSVTSQRTVGYATALAAGMPSRINNVFMDHLESDPDSRAALLRLATIAAAKGDAIGICHVFHQYELHALTALADQLRSKGYVFATASQVTDQPAPDGLDAGVRTRL